MHLQPTLSGIDFDPESLHGCKHVFIASITCEHLTIGKILRLFRLDRLSVFHPILSNETPIPHVRVILHGVPVGTRGRQGRKHSFAGMISNHAKFRENVYRRFRFQPE